MKRRYLIDSNCFIAAKNSYYRFSIAPSFWKQLEKHIENGSIVIHDTVFKEIKKGQDDLATWIQKIHIPTVLKPSNFLSEYAKVIRYIADCGFYNDQGLKAWSDQSIADPQLIATALKEKDLIIVTAEQPTGNKNTRRKSNPKIPDVAKDLNVITINLFEMMSELNIKL